MDDRPELILHAGFPKCGTSTVQAVFCMDGHRLCRALDLLWIGHGFQPWAVRSPVPEIMYDRPGTLARIAALEVGRDQTCFISSEALYSNAYALEALTARFRVTRIVMTVRMPLPMIMSEYCWSGWLAYPPEELCFPGRIDRLSALCAELAQTAPVVVCPLEASDFASRFCDCLVGRVPAGVEEMARQVGQANASIPPALAEALFARLGARGIGPVPGPARSLFVNAAMKDPGPPDFASRLPHKFREVFGDGEFVRAKLDRYDAFLADYGVPAEVRREVVEKSRKRMAELAGLPPLDKATRAAIEEHADAILTSVMTAHPELAGG